MNIAIASGKGGTGKTTVAANLAASLLSRGLHVCATDCDVEEPNLHLFLQPNWDKQVPVSVAVPEIDENLCLGPDCAKCVQLCRFKALIMMAGNVMAFPELCHGCGLCTLACPSAAITEGKRLIGEVRIGKAKGLTITDGLMRIGEAMAPPLIQAVKDDTGAADIRLFDCPPGTSCPVIKSLDGMDYAILVAEPTPFGLHDLDLAVQVLHKLNIPFGVVINRDGMGDDATRQYLDDKGIPLLGSIPHSLEAASLYSKGNLHVGNLPEFDAIYSDLWDAVLKQQEAAR